MTRIFDDVNKNYNEEYTVHGELIFQMDDKKLAHVFKDFPNKGKLEKLVKDIKCLYKFSFL